MREIRKFGTIEEVIELPNLTDIQIRSYNTFLQVGKSAPERENTGLQSAFKEVFPIDETERGRQTGLVLDFLEYTLQPPEFSPEECREKDLSYHSGLFAKLQLVHKDTGLIKEDQVFLGDLGSHVPGIGQSIGTHDGQDDVVPDACLLLRGEDVAGSVAEEGQDVVVRP